MSYLIVVHIGPVQEFIAAARRGRDLWFGSWLLSELSKAVAARLAQEKEGQLLFPAPENQQQLEPDSNFNVANKVVAILPEVPATLSDMLQETVQERLRALWNSAKQGKGPLESEAVAWAQIADLPDLFWVTVPLNLEREHGYVVARTQAEALMAARKSARTFGKIPWERTTGQPKSSLDGVRESVIPEGAYANRDDSDKAKQRKATTLYEMYGARPAERLSGVDLLKRHGSRKQQHDFPSTSHVAAQPLLEWLRTLPLDRQNTIRMAWLDYVTRLPRKAQERTSTSHPVLQHSDGSMLFESRLREELEKDEFEQASEHLRAFLKNCLEGHKPLPYYALLLADGDRMGKVIDNQTTPEQHQALSRALAGFASEAATIVRNHSGELIYSGGDDVLALLPLHEALACVSELAETFAHQMQEFKDAQGNRPTLSAGLAVSHHIEPLSDALDLARQAEKAAKSVPGKNALAVTVSKRSGADVTVTGHWGEVDERLELFTDLHRAEAIPDGAAYDLRDLALRFTLTPLTEEALERAKRETEPRNDEEQMRLALGKSVVPEAMRILRRKRGQRGQATLTDSLLGQVEAKLQGQAMPKDEESLAAKLRWAQRQVQEVRRLADEIIVARLFADAAQQAAPRKENEEVPA